MAHLIHPAALRSTPKGNTTHHPLPTPIRTGAPQPHAAARRRTARRAGLHFATQRLANVAKQGSYHVLVPQQLLLYLEVAGDLVPVDLRSCSCILK